ncbi:MAG: hypothetical protein KJP07_00080 [Desulfatitalea sp.]|nr:hypothetical protein [Desulfatitalea sp.]
MAIFSAGASRASSWKDVKHGLVYGSQNFIEDIKARFLPDQPDNEIPQQRHLPAADASQQLIQRASVLLDFDLGSIHGRKRLRSPELKEKRDMFFCFGKPNGISTRRLATCFA